MADEYQIATEDFEEEKKMEMKKEASLESLEKEIYNTRDVVGILDLFLKRAKEKDKNYKCRKFTFHEVMFLVQLIFYRPKEQIFIYLADYLRNNTDFKYLPFNGMNSRALKFFHNILFLQNARKAAIATGYSPRSAKQTGYRLVKKIQGYKRIGSSSKFIKIV